MTSASGLDPPDVEPIDPGLRQLLLRRTGSTQPPGDGEAGDDVVPVVARLSSSGARVPGLAIAARFSDVVTARVRLSDVFTVRRDPHVLSLKAARRVEPALAGSVTDIQARPADLQTTNMNPPTGLGVIIAVLDWGLDVGHANFRRPDGSTRVIALWDQRGGMTDTSPAPFGYGRVHLREEIDGWLRTPDPYAHGYDVADIDPHGHGTHGTHVTDIAAGNGRAPGSAPGVAPHSDILFVHLRADDTQREGDLGDSVRLLEAVSWVVDTAAGRPLIFHMSLGRTGGPHDASPLVTQALDRLLSTEPGVAAVMSCGNYYETRMHAGGTVTPGDTVTLEWEVPQPGDEPSELEIWYDGDDRLRVAVLDPSGRSMAHLPPDSEAVVRAADGAVAMSGFHRSGDPGNGAHHADLFLWASASAGTYRIVLTALDVHGVRFDAWIERTDPRRQSRFAAATSTPEETTGSICNGWLPLAVGAYDSRDPRHPPGPFSSEGPTRDGRTKPDVSAPGLAIRAARSSAPRPDGTRSRDALTVKSGTSMAAPHVSGAVALVFEIAAPLLLPMAVTRWLIMESARQDPPREETDRLRYGAGRLDVAAACRLARALRSGLTAPATAVAQPPAGVPATTGTWIGRESPPQAMALLAAPARGLSDIAFSWDDETTLGQLQVSGTTVSIEPRPPIEHRSSPDDATRAALRQPSHAVVQSSGSGGFDVSAFGPATLPTPPVAAVSADTTVRHVVLAGGTRVYLPADPNAPGRRWVDVPGLSELFRLPAADRAVHVDAWARHTARSGAGLSDQQARALGVATLRVMLATHAARAFPIVTVHLDNGTVDAGGVLDGITLPIVRTPVSEPHCYLPVIAQVEGRLESINAWDLGAGVSLGPIQFNAQRGALIRFLARLSSDDPHLFTTALGRPLGWTITTHGDHADLGVLDSTGGQVLHGTSDDGPRLVSYLQCGTVGGSGRDGVWRRRVAGCFRDVVAWPHVQDLIVDVSAWWLESALRRIRAEGIGPLDPAGPDRSAFVLTALLLSATVRFSASLTPLLAALRPWPGVDAKLAHWPDGLAAAPRFAALERRLRGQQRDAERVHDQIARLLDAAIPPPTAETRDT